jgi:hypothetical protein
MDSHTIHKEKTQRPMGIVLVKPGDQRRKLDISANTKIKLKERKEKDTHSVQAEIEII